MVISRFTAPSSVAFALALAAAGCGSSELDADGSVLQRTPSSTASSAANVGVKRRVGSMPALLSQLAREKTASSRLFTFPTSRTPVPTLVEEYHHQNDHLSMVGRAADSADSAFIFKADGRGAYGWLVYKDRELAWEYTTDGDGQVVVEEVPVTKVLPVCPIPPSAAHRHSDAEGITNEEPGRVFIPSGTFPAHVGTYPGGDVLKLESRPASKNVWFIDFSDTMNGSEPKSGHTKAAVWQAWAITAAQFYSFDINVTTDRDVYAAAPVANTGCTTFHYAEICPDAPRCPQRSSCGLNTFGTKSCCNNYLYEDGYGTGRIIAHEAGHALGLSHDEGSPGGAYYEGLPDFKWTVLMGNVWPGDSWGEDALYQLSKGEYDTATNDEDDLAIISERLDYVDDDIAEAKMLTIEGNMISREMNWGQIERASDSDSWTFAIGSTGSRVALEITRIEDKGGAMLDVDASIVDSAHQVLAHDNPTAARHANLDVDLPAGQYSLIVKGGAEGTPQKGFSNYSSHGLYGIHGSVTNGAGIGDGGTGGEGTGGAGMGGGSQGGGQTSAGGGGSGGAAGGGIAGNGGSTGPAGAAGVMAGVSHAESADDVGCACRTAPPRSPASPWLVAALGVLGAAFIRRRRQSSMLSRRRSWFAGFAASSAIFVLTACGSSGSDNAGAAGSGAGTSSTGGVVGGGATIGGSASGSSGAPVNGGAGTAGAPAVSGGSVGTGGAAGATGSAGASGMPGGPVVFSKNVKVNDDASSGMHTEVTLVSGANGLLLAGWMDFRDARTCAYSVSTDSGQTWGKNVFIRVSAGGQVGDPTVAIDADERLYAVCQDYGVSQIRIMTSTDTGSSWSSVRSIQGAPDKPWIGASPTEGGVAFLSWLGGAAGIKRTTDGGMTWGPVQRLEFLNHGTTISVGTSGVVHVAYTPNGGPLRYVRSKDLGESWENAKTIAQTGTFCWSDCAGPRQHPIVGGGSDPTGKYVVATWPANLPSGQGDEDIWIVYSSDGGDTWTEPVRVNDNENESRQLQPWAAVDAYGRVHVAWTDARNGRNETWYARSADPRKGFEKNVQVSDDSGPLGGGFLGDYKGIAISGNDVVVLWNDTRDSGSHIYSARAIGAAGP